MKSYPSISTKFEFEKRMVAFDKLDGSNIRAEWSKKKGFYKFGTRTRLLDETDPVLGEAKPLFLDKYSEDIARICHDQKWERTVVFYEFFGPNSFAGSHKEEEHDVVLFDVDVYRKGMMDPFEFIKTFGHLDIPEVLYEGQLTEDFITSVKQSTLAGMSHEGVVCKMKHRKLNTSVMFKIKSRLWLESLRTHCKDNQQLYERLK